MISITVAALRQNVNQTIELVNVNHFPITITNDKGKGAVLVGEDEWAAVEETLYLTSIPSMTRLLEDSITEPIENCINENQAW